MEKTTRQKLELFREPFYRMMNMEDYLSMDEIQAMWEALLIHNNIPIPDYWEIFIDKVNCMASEKRKFFYECFDTYLLFADNCRTEDSDN